MYLWKPKTFNLFQIPHPIRARILMYEFYAISGPEIVKALFKGSWIYTSIPFVKFVLGYVCGVRVKALSLDDKDGSGGAYIPHMGSTKGLLPFWNRFSDNITQQLHDMCSHTGPDWDYNADLMKVVENKTTVSILNALCGPYLLGLNPSFLEGYWDFDHNLQIYLQASAVRRRVLGAVQIWQQHVRNYYDNSSSALMAMTRSGGSILSIFDLYQDPNRLPSIRAEVDAYVLRRTDGYVQFDIDHLFHCPIFQAVYAETLRHRRNFYIIRISDRVVMNIQDWVIPRHKVIVTPTAHPMDEYWIGRFLKYPSKSGQCPGPHLAKCQILLTTALISLFDCKILKGCRNVQEDSTLKGFGSGVSHPTGNVPMMMRCRDKVDM
ncbi:Pfs, NACHT and ankyrin domain protein [Camillea tinctor]|nr:Pfs, NACHT and ankyrin domain protein [Camillea tinctor]